MDFHSLPRRDLQALCKKNRIPANMTNIAMADALQALQTVEGLDGIQEAKEFLSPKKAEGASPDQPRTSRRTSTRRRPTQGETKENTAISVPRTRRASAKASAVKKMEIEEEEGEKQGSETMPEAEAPSMQGSPLPRSRRVSARGSEIEQLVLEGEDEEEKKQENRERIPETPAAQTGRRTRRGASKKEEKGIEEGPVDTPATTTGRRTLGRKQAKKPDLKAEEEMKKDGAKTCRYRTRQSSRKQQEKTTEVPLKSRTRSNRTDGALKMAPFPHEEEEEAQEHKAADDGAIGSDELSAHSAQEVLLSNEGTLERLDEMVALDIEGAEGQLEPILDCKNTEGEEDSKGYDDGDMQSGGSDGQKTQGNEEESPIRGLIVSQDGVYQKEESHSHDPSAGINGEPIEQRSIDENTTEEGEENRQLQLPSPPLSEALKPDEPSKATVIVDPHPLSGTNAELIGEKEETDLKRRLAGMTLDEASDSIDDLQVSEKTSDPEANQEIVSTVKFPELAETEPKQRLAGMTLDEVSDSTNDLQISEKTSDPEANQEIASIVKCSEFEETDPKQRPAGIVDPHPLSGTSAELTGEKEETDLKRRLACMTLDEVSDSINDLQVSEKTSDPEANQEIVSTVKFPELAETEPKQRLAGMTLDEASDSIEDLQVSEKASDPEANREIFSAAKFPELEKKSENLQVVSPVVIAANTVEMPIPSFDSLEILSPEPSKIISEADESPNASLDNAIDLDAGPTEPDLSSGGIPAPSSPCLEVRSPHLSEKTVEGLGESPSRVSTKSIDRDAHLSEPELRNEQITTATGSPNHTEKSSGVISDPIATVVGDSVEITKHKNLLSIAPSPIHETAPAPKMSLEISIIAGSDPIKSAPENKIGARDFEDEGSEEKNAKLQASKGIYRAEGEKVVAENDKENEVRCLTALTTGDAAVKLKVAKQSKQKLDLNELSLRKLRSLAKEMMAAKNNNNKVDEDKRAALAELNENRL